jgi:hypothetical protein
VVMACCTAGGTGVGGMRWQGRPVSSPLGVDVAGAVSS